MIVFVSVDSTCIPRKSLWSQYIRHPQIHHNFHNLITLAP